MLFKSKQAFPLTSGRQQIISTSTTSFKITNHTINFDLIKDQNQLKKQHNKYPCQKLIGSLRLKRRIHQLRSLLITVTPIPTIIISQLHKMGSCYTLQQGKVIKVSQKEEEQSKQSSSQQQDPQQYFDNRVIKPLPDYTYNPQLKALAETLQREIINSNPNVRFKDVIGLDRTKQLLKQAVLFPMKYPHLFTGLLEPWKGILLFGPPGTGKTMLAKAVATQCKTTFFNISASTIVSKWRGDSEKLVRLLFELARYHQPSTIFVDEIDAIMSERTSQGEHQASRRMKTELLIQLDGLIKGNQRVFLLAASNLPWDLDSALLRRLEKRVRQSYNTDILYTDYGVTANSLSQGEDIRESAASRESLKNRLRSFCIEVKAINIQDYSGSDIRLVCKQAAMRPLRRLMEEIQRQPNSKLDPNDWSFSVKPQDVPQIPKVHSKDLDTAIQCTKKSTIISVEKYQKWESQFGSL